MKVKEYMCIFNYLIHKVGSDNIRYWKTTEKSLVWYDHNDKRHIIPLQVVLADA